MGEPKQITKRPGYDDSQPGSFVLSWRGVAIPHFGDKSQISEFINQLPDLDPHDKEQLWGLWCSVDALIGGYEHEYSDPDIWALGEVLSEMDSPGFREGTADWIDETLDFAHEHEAEIELTVIVPN